MKSVFAILLSLLTGLAIQAQTLSDLYDQVKSSVVTIYVEELVNSGFGDPTTFTSNMGLGSGVLISEKYVLTAAHVVGNAEEIKVEFIDGKTLPGKTFRISRTADVAVVELMDIPLNPNIAKIGDSDKVRIGDDIFVVGAPMGLSHSLSKGIISGRHTEKRLTSEGNALEFFQTDASINTGNSGGPMFNMQGEVIGIVSSILSRSGGFEGIGFAATSGIANTLLNARSSKYFGVDAILLPYELARALNVPQESGLLVQNVVKNSPAYLSGLQGGFLTISVDDEDVLVGGDIILTVDDIKITGMEGFDRMMTHLDSIKSTTRHKITVLRAGEQLELYWLSFE